MLLISKLPPYMVILIDVERRVSYYVTLVAFTCGSATGLPSYRFDTRKIQAQAERISRQY